MLQKVKNKSVFAVNPPAVPCNPLRIRSAGIYEVVEGWSEPKVQKWFVELAWTVSGVGEALVGDSYLRLSPGDILLYHPGDFHHLRGVSERWQYCWMTFDHPEVALWLGAFHLEAHKLGAGPCPAGAFMEIMENLRKITPEGERQASIIAYEILLQASSRLRPVQSNSLSVRAKRLMDVNYKNPHFNITELSSQLKVHRSTLFRHFTGAYSHTPSTYLLNLRLSHGLDLLQHTHDSIQDVALLAGFTDAGYFARCIRKTTGKSPRRFRGG